MANSVMRCIWIRVCYSHPPRRPSFSIGQLHVIVVCIRTYSTYLSWQPVSFLTGGYVCSFENREWYTFMHNSETKCVQSSWEKSLINHEAQPAAALQSHQL